MEELINKMAEINDLNLVLQEWCVENCIEQPKIISYPLEKVSKLYDNFLDKYGSQSNLVALCKNSTEPIWFENQLILFQWTVVTLSFTRNIYIKDFNNSQIEFLSLIFRHKENYIIDYETKCMLVRGKQIRNAWKIEEQEMLASVIQKIHEKNKWNQIARQLYKVSEGRFFRQGKHCRERWYSYMENRNSGKEWNVEADIELLQLISAIGKRWSIVANKFTKPQSRLTLRKRYKILLSEAQAKAENQISEKQAVEILLQEKYENVSIAKINVNPKKQKCKFSKDADDSMAKPTIGQYKSNLSLIKSNEEQSNRRAPKQKCEENELQKISIEMEQDIQENLDHHPEQKPDMLFLNQIHFPENMCSMAYMPVQFYQPIFPIMAQNAYQTPSYNLYETPFNLGDCFLFY